MLQEKIDKLLPDLIKLRRELHKSYPELSGYEKETTAKIKSIISESGNKIVEFEDAGLVEIIKTESPKYNVLIRADIDALPIQEINQFDYKSQNEGVSHKCGHDGHTTNLIGLSKILKELPLSHINIFLLWQSAEENGKGAKRAYKEFFKDINIDFAFALHNLPAYEENKILIKEGIFTPEVKSIIIKLKGKTSHAGEQEKGKNPAMMISDFIEFMKKMNHTDPGNPNFYIATPIYINLGTKDYGISAGEGEVHYTLRSNNHLLFQNNTEKISDKLEQLSNKYGISFEISWTEEFSAVVNDEDATEIIKKVANKNNFDLKIIKSPMKWGEDFGIFTQKFKGAMFGIGIGKDKPSLHNPDYDFNDNIIPASIKMFYGALNYLNNK